MEFNEDGTLKVTKKKTSDHLTVLRLLDELDFPLGKRLFIQVLRGEENARIKKLNLHTKVYHGSLGGYSDEELSLFLESLIAKGLVQTKRQHERYTVLVLTRLGQEELIDHKHDLAVDETLATKNNGQTFIRKHYTCAPVTKEDRAVFEACDFFLNSFTDEQKKAIITTTPRQLCIAGAGTGKTRVLTHKIVYLVRFCGVDPKDILAITFTRKARKEMLTRLAKLLPDEKIKVETFNSFAEKELLQKGSQLYGKEKRMASPKEFFTIVLKAISAIGFDLDTFLEHYFTVRERRGKEQRELFFSFLYDFRAILDAYLARARHDDYFQERLSDAKLSEKITAQNIVKIAKLVSDELEEEGLRTYSDQLVDINRLYDAHEELKRTFSWVLVDEYQDVSPQQTRLLDHICAKNLFVVGDPRQSIFAWRGANPNIIFDYIMPQTTVIELTTNFRSTKAVVNFSNMLIAQTNNGRSSYSALRSFDEREGLVSVVKNLSEDAEAIAIVDQIKMLACPRKEIFVLSRTNKGLENVKTLCDREGIKYVLRTDEKQELLKESQEDEITLSTVHAIKGLEAEIVFVLGVNISNYPCKSKDHRYVDLLAAKEGYNQYEEERRILYVACTRAKKELRISYTGAPSPFLSAKVLTQATHNGREKQTQKQLDDVMKLDPSHLAQRVQEQRKALKRWRYLEAQERDIPAYMIFNDRALEQLLEMQPLSLDELDAIAGLGKVKIREFGEDILRVLHH